MIFPLFFMGSPPSAQLRATWEIADSRPFVGQGVELTIRVESSEPPRLIAPRSNVARIEAGDSDRSVSRVGKLTIFRRRLVVERAGSLTIPGFSAEAGGERARTKRLRIEAREPPLDGRPGNFLGGVGHLKITSEAVPKLVKRGRPFEVRLRLEGPGAVGARGSPDFGIAKLRAAGAEIEFLPAEYRADQPARTYRIRIRPRRSGSIKIGPFAVAWFDPRSGRYSTSIAPSLSVEVQEPPPFDPAAVVDSTRGERTEPRLNIYILLFILIIITIIFSWPLYVIFLRKRRVSADPWARARRLAKELDGRWGAEEVASRSIAGLSSFLEESIGRPRGALTPLEARAGVEKIAPDDAELADGTERFVHECDRVLFGGRNEDDGERLAEEGRALFQKLAEVRARRGRHRPG